MEFRDLKRQYEALREDIDAAAGRVIRSAAFIHGAEVTELEEALARFTGVRHCVGCANGTDALELSLMAWEIGPGDAVIVPDFTFFSTAEVVSRVGAVPFFADVEAKTYNLDPDSLREVILRIEKEGKYRLKAVISVDLFGLPADYDRIVPLVREHGLFLLEDGAQGFGGSLHGKKACSFGDISTTSFFPSKPLGCYGDGGAVFTDNDMWAERIRSLAVHGKGESKYDNVRIGMNSRLDTIQAAVLLVKLRALKAYELTEAERCAKRYSELLRDLPVTLPEVSEGFRSAWAQYTIKLKKGTERAAVQAKLKAEGIPSMIYYMKPMHLQKAFAGTDSAKACCPVSEDLSERVLSLPFDPYKTEEELTEVMHALVRATGR